MAFPNYLSGPKVVQVDDILHNLSEPKIVQSSKNKISKVPLVWPSIEHNITTHRIEQDAIINNDLLENKLNVLCVFFNIHEFKRRYKLAHEFINRMKKENHIVLYIVELAYKNQKFHLTTENNPNHLQLRTNSILWLKENMFNIGIKKLLPNNWKSVACIDMDIEFENPHWSLDTLKILNGSRDLVQLFSHCVNLDKNQDAMQIYSSLGFRHSKGKPYEYNEKPENYNHPGYGFAITRKTYEKIGGFYELNILGSGDQILLTSAIGMVHTSLVNNLSKNYVNSILNFQERCKNIRVGYVPGIIKHYYHGPMERRQYDTRELFLVKYQFDPYEHLSRNENGLLFPSSKFPEKLYKKIERYFENKREDDD